jgi:hypothetical protein
MARKETTNPQRYGAEDLIGSAKVGSLTRVKALLTISVDVNSRAANGATALFAASQNGHLEVVKTLVAANAEIDAKPDKALPTQRTRAPWRYGAVHGLAEWPPGGGEGLARS